MLAPIVVTANHDVSDPSDDNTTLREALVLAEQIPNHDEIIFMSHLNGKEILLTQGPLQVNESVMIEGIDLLGNP